jgi:hypothetical protein
MSKRRSGLKNDQRAYNYCFCSPPQTCSPITISITDIATRNQQGTDWLLNKDTTIQLCEILDIGYGNSLVISPYKLINRGTINNQYGVINNSSNSNGIINKGMINNQNGAIINYTGGIDNTGGTMDNTAGGFINNNFGGIIDNTGGTIDNTAGLIYNDLGTIYLGDGTCGSIGTIITSGGAIIGNTPSNTCP